MKSQEASNTVANYTSYLQNAYLLPEVNMHYTRCWQQCFHYRRVCANHTTLS